MKLKNPFAEEIEDAYATAVPEGLDLDEVEAIDGPEAKADTIIKTNGTLESKLAKTEAKLANLSIRFDEIRTLWPPFRDTFTRNVRLNKDEMMKADQSIMDIDQALS